MDLDQFNALDGASLQPTLLACCDAHSWAQSVASGRPFATVESVLENADQAARQLTASDVERALAAHPRIGERAEGQDTPQAWSRQEQAAVLLDDRAKADLIQVNRDYEERFGRVFLICASGLSTEQIVAAARARLTHDEATELRVVADELRKIALLRLRKVLTATSPTTPPTAAARRDRGDAPTTARENQP